MLHNKYKYGERFLKVGHQNQRENEGRYYNMLFVANVSIKNKCTVYLFLWFSKLVQAISIFVVVLQP